MTTSVTDLAVTKSEGSFCRICKQNLPPKDSGGPCGHVIGPFTVPHFGFGSLDPGWSLTVICHQEAQPTQVQTLHLELCPIDPPRIGQPIVRLPIAQYRLTGLHCADELTAVLGTLHTPGGLVKAVEVGGLLLLERRAEDLISMPYLPIAHIIESWYKRD